MNIEPIRRSKELTPLSREHHDSLLFVWKLRQGLQKGASLDLMKKYVSWYWQNHIKPHFHDEEKILTPQLPPDQPLVQQMKDEHAQLRDIIISLDDEGDAESLKMLADMFDKHIRFEERELFGYIEKTLSPEQLDNIHKQLEKHPECDTEWKEEFWK